MKSGDAEAIGTLLGAGLVLFLGFMAILFRVSILCLIGWAVYLAAKYFHVV